MISEDPVEIRAMEHAANDPRIIMLSDWDYYNSSQYKEADANSHLQILYGQDSIPQIHMLTVLAVSIVF
jgi:hypothetical protein